METLVSSMQQPTFWLSVLQVIWVNILLSGDNAVVIALACRGLPPRERMWGMIIGAGFASLLLIVFTVVVSKLLTLPYLMLVGSIALLWIAIKLLAPQGHDSEDTPEATSDLWRAVRLVVIADIIMSLDNVVAVAAIAQGGYLLLTIGLAVSIPMVIAGSAIIMALLERFPILVWGGAGILGWVAGEIFSGDPVVQGFFHNLGIEEFEIPAEIVGCLIVLVTGYMWRRRHHMSLEEA